MNTSSVSTCTDTAKDRGTDAPHQGFDLLRFGAVRCLILWKGFPYVFQAALAAVFVALIAISWGVHAPEGINAKLFAKSHLATLLVWGIWWPSMVIIAVVFGRIWCMVCPLELVSNLSERIARAVRIPQRRLSRWIASGALIVALYLLLQLLIAGLHIHRVPAYTCWFLIGLLTTALVTGFIFKDRAFCRGFCPVGLLLGTYGRGGMLAIRAGTEAKCNACTDRTCIRESNRTRADSRSCPSLLNPPKLNSNKECLVCCQCIKACEPGNMQLLLRRPFPKSDFREAVASWPITLFVMIVSGFVLGELFSEWPAAEKIFLVVPERIASAIHWPAAAGWLEGLWSLIVVPLTLWFFLAAAVRSLGVREPISTLWRRMALPMAVVIATGHVAKGMAKFVSWAAFLPRALHDPSGFATSKAIATKTLPAPTPLAELSTVAVIALALLLARILYAWRENKLSSPGSTAHCRTGFPVVALAAIFAAIILGWIAQ